LPDLLAVLKLLDGEVHGDGALMFRIGRITQGLLLPPVLHEVVYLIAVHGAEGAFGNLLRLSIRYRQPSMTGGINAIWSSGSCSKK
jgi:hypothetical protein